MIAKNKKGKSFGGCVRYVMNDGAEVLAAEGVVADDAATITRDFAIQRSGRPEIKQPVGHIAVSFSPEDSPRMTGDFMLKLAHEYMAEMGIGNTQYIIVRHHNTDHDHFHIVYNRIDNDLKLISVNNDYRRNVAACKKIKDRHGLTYGTGKEKVNRPKLTGADKVKYQIHDEIAANLLHSTSYSDLEKRLRQAGITIQYKYRSGAEESPENIQGVSFEKGGVTFKGSQIDRKFSHANLSKVLSANLNDAWEKMKDMIMPKDTPRPEQATPPVTPSPEPPLMSLFPLSEPAQRPVNPPRPAQPPTPPEQYRQFIRGAEITAEQWETLQSGGHTFVENMDLNDGSGGKFSEYVFLDDEKKRVFYSSGNPDKFVKYGHYEMRLRDKMQVEAGFVTKAKTIWHDGRFAYLYIWKDHTSGAIKHSFTDPRAPKEQLENESRTPMPLKQQEPEQEKPTSDNRFQRPLTPNRTPPTVNRTPPPPRTVPPKRTVPPPKKGPKIRR